MEFPNELKYAETDEWVRVEGDIAIVGLTDFAQDQLSDLVYFESLVEVGEKVDVETALGTVESVKSAGDVVSPVAGEVIEINTELEDEPEIVNSDPYDTGWMFKIKLSEPLDEDRLMSAEEYQEQCEE
jgi:glycine cleavage system H protein